jgi:thioredoxin 1
MTPLPEIKYLTEVSYSGVVKSNRHPCLIAILADWSATSHTLKTMLENELNPFNSIIDCYFIDIDENKSISEIYAIRTLPTILIFNNGALVEKIEDLISAKELITRIEAYI